MAGNGGHVPWDPFADRDTLKSDEELEREHREAWEWINPLEHDSEQAAKWREKQEQAAKWRKEQEEKAAQASMLVQQQMAAMQAAQRQQPWGGMGGSSMQQLTYPYMPGMPMFPQQASTMSVSGMPAPQQVFTFGLQPRKIEELNRIRPGERKNMISLYQSKIANLRVALQDRSLLLGMDRSAESITDEIVLCERCIGYLQALVARAGNQSASILPA